MRVKLKLLPIWVGLVGLVSLTNASPPSNPPLVFKQGTNQVEKKNPLLTSIEKVQNTDNPLSLQYLLQSLLLNNDYKNSALLSYIIITYGTCDAYRSGHASELLDGGLIPKILINTGINVSNEPKQKFEDINQKLPLERLLPEAIAPDKRERLLEALKELESDRNTLLRTLKKLGPPNYDPGYMFKMGRQDPPIHPIPLEIAWEEACGELARNLE